MSTRSEFFIKGRPLRDEPFHYTLCGVPGIYLLNGVMLHDDDGYGQSFEIEDVEDLHDAIAAQIIERPGIMTGSELRFIRKRMRFTQADIAKRMRVSAQTIANYEKGATSLDGPADTMLRVLYMLYVLPPDAGKAFIDELMEAAREQHQTHHSVIPRSSPIWKGALLEAA